MLICGLFYQTNIIEFFKESKERVFILIILKKAKEMSALE